METRTIVEVASGLLIALLTGAYCHYRGFVAGWQDCCKVFSIPEAILLELEKQMEEEEGK